MPATRTTTKRGYGTSHQTARQAAADTLPAQCVCERLDCPHHDGRCPTILTADQPWDLGHTDDRTGYTGPECVPCNRSAGGRNAAAATNAQAGVVHRDW